MRIQRQIVVSVSGAACLIAAASLAADATWRPGLYSVEVRIGMQNAPPVAPPMFGKRCLTSADFENGGAFGVLSDNSIKTCPVFDFELDKSTASFQIACPGPNAASAMARFEATRTGYRGVIRMQTAGIATLSETQVGTWIEECR